MSKLVSIFMITYYHGKYIAKALDSVLMQKVDFEYEIVVGEDYSKDETREILLAYQKAHPGKLKLLFHEKNIGPMNNHILTLQACTGKYIAICEGDDYWIDPYKLSKQIKFLEKNKDYSYCFSNSLIVNENDENTGLFESFIPGDIHLRDLLEKGWIAPTASLVFRSDSILPFPDWAAKIPNGDYITQLLSCSNGSKAYGFNEIFAAYRKHSGGVSASDNYHFQSIYVDLNMIKLMKYFDKHTKNKFLKYTNEKRKNYLRDIVSKSRIYDFISIKSLWNLLKIGEFYLVNNLITERIFKKRIEL